MKSTLEYLREQKDMAWHNRLCYSETYGMNTPKEGQEAQFAESVRDCEIVDELIEIVKSATKADPADSQQSQAGVLTYGATKADIKVAQSELSNKMCSTVAQRNAFLGNDIDIFKGKSDDELFNLLSE